MAELRDYLITPPWMHPAPTERSYVIRACRGELTSRGLDAEAVIRYAVAPVIAYAVGFNLKITDTVPDLDLDPAWLRFLEQSAEASGGSTDTDALFKNALGGVFPAYVRWWAATAPLEDIENWTAPQCLPEQPPEPDPERVDHAQWILDRFSQTYYQPWQTNSLRLEWLYQHAQRLGPCESRWMAERRVAVDDISRMLAERDARTWEQGSTLGAEPSGITVNDFTVVAVENIDAGRFEVAAGIFEGFIRLEPLNAAAHNNYGFCLLPLNPAKALKELRRAEELGFEDRMTNAADQVLALHRTGSDAEAVELARASLEAGHTHGPAYLWEKHGNDLRLRLYPDAHTYLEDLLAKILNEADLENGHRD